eukprot:CAMPEP_0196153012 /NCGR_PEP_ID=MMETSP0910-20130528/36480_1 /TAXON_ID=49265 /ORGANISM="Thalassiosira rotula, Strain GSO102" /LENGTH=403 /DNA_ID=CAMNT_0041416727 /DNA_START=32 /DNA_END=1243 /DNA_ORIENTATION=-
MNNRTSRVAEVEVGTPPSGFPKWESSNVHVHGFSDLISGPAVRTRITSPEFTCLGRDGWFLEMVLHGRPGTAWLNINNLSIESEEIIKVPYSLSVRNLAGEEVVFIPGIYCSDERTLGYTIHLQRIMNALVEGTLTVEVRMKTIGPTNDSPAAFIPKNPIRENILKLFMDESSADVVFEVGGGQQQAVENDHKKAKTSPISFYAHRLILQKCAPALAEICGSDSGGRGDNNNMTSVPITNIKPNVFRSLLHYVYGGKLSDAELEENAKDLIDAADKFGVVNLKLKAEVCYVESITLAIDNILDNLLYADSKNCALLKETVVDFVVENKEDVLGKVSFDNVPGSVVTDVLTAMTRGEEKGDGGVVNTNNIKTMRVGTLRTKLREKGLDVDGTREAMIALLSEHS